MRYYKVDKDGYIESIGVGGIGEEITESQYKEIASFIRTKPAGTDTTDYCLRADLSWEEYTVEPVEPDISDTEAYDIIFGGAE